MSNPERGGQMAVRYIFGRAGRGKTHFVFEEIKEDLKRGGEHRLFLIVPEQFTLQSERDLIEKLGVPGIMRVEVLSFTRLAHKVFNEVGGLTRTVINEQGKNMVLRRIIDEAAPELTIYRKAARQDGFVSRFSEFLTQLKIYHISPEDIRQNLAKMGDDGLVKQKLHDIATIYERFNRYLAGRYIDTEDYINLFIEKVEEAGFLRGARVWIDGFETFSPQTLKIIEKIVGLAADIAITFTIDFAGSGRDSDLFILSKQAYNKIHAMALEKGLQERIIDLNKEKRGHFKSKEIAHLEEEIYAYPYNRYQDEVKDIHLFAATNVNTEIEIMAAQVISLVRDRGYRWRDIAVVCNDLETYGSLIKRVFDEYGIPCFLDQKRDIMNNPIIEFILSSLDIIQRGYRYEDVFRFLKTGFSSLDMDACERMENYVLKYGIRGSRWKEAFTLAGGEDLGELNLFRQRLIGPLEALEQKIKTRNTFAEMTKVLYDYLESNHIPQKLEVWIERLREQGHYEYVLENTQIWNIVMEVFDQVVEILGDQLATVKEYKRVLEAGFLSFQVGIIPTTVDQVLVGSIQRSKSQDIKALFVVGVNDGVLPSGKEDQGIIPAEEKAVLKEKGLDLGFDRETRACEEKFLIYSALAKPTRYLWVSYALADNEGRALRPSILIDRLKRLYNRLEIESDVLNDRQTQMHKVGVPKSTFKHLLENLRLFLDGKPMDPIWWDVYHWYYTNETWREMREWVAGGFFHSNQANFMGSQTAKMLYRQPIRSSISRLEQFVNCPFAHFVRYGLRPQERKLFEMGAPDMGEFFHGCLLSFAEKLSREKINWRELEQDQCRSIMDGIMDELAPRYGDGVLYSTHRYKYLLNRLKRIGRRAVWTLTEHLRKGDFDPLGHEVSFGRKGKFPPIEVKLADGETIYLEGRIDRVDLLDAEDGTYVKIIDYKSGKKEFRLSDVYYGLALQLVVYLHAVLENRERLKRNKLKPAGIFYFKIDDPLVKTDQMVLEAVEKEIRKKLKMDGIVLKDVNLVRRMDREVQGWSEVLPIGMGNNGFYQNSSALGETEFMALIKHVEGLVKEISGEILRGNIRIEPVKDGQRKACDYCDYQSICQFDSLFGNKYKHLKPLDKDEVIAKILGKEVTAGGSVD